MKKKLLTIGIPCFNEELNIPDTYTLLKKTLSVLNTYSLELLFVDNGSTDSTRQLIEKLAKKDKCVTGVFLSRNFGPEASMQAAVETAKGHAVVLYDCDRQDPPELILKFVKKWEEGYEVVVGKYTNTEDGFLMKIMRKSFYRLFKAVSNIEVPVNSSTYSLIDRKVILALKQLPEKYRFFRGLRAWVGFKAAYVLYQRRKRQFGEGTNFFKYIRYSERSFFGFSYIPLDLIVYIGFLLVMVSFIFIIIYLILALLYGNPIKGSIALFVSIIFFGGVQLLAISVIGKYIQVIVEETKARPAYIIEKIINEKKTS